MKRIIFILISTLITVLPLAAQDGLSIGKYFNGQHKGRKDVTEVFLKGNQISDYGLTVFRSITMPGNTPEAQGIENAVGKDAAMAVDKEVIRRGGRLYFGFFCLPSDKKRKLNRYILYRNNALKAGKNTELTLVYMEATGTPEDLERLMGR